jgi:hypothetical protein
VLTAPAFETEKYGTSGVDRSKSQLQQRRNSGMFGHVRKEQPGEFRTVIE